MDERIIPFKVIRSARKTFSLEVNAKAELVVRAPLKASIKKINATIEGHTHWIAKKQAQARLRLSLKPTFKADELLLYLGKPYPLKFVASMTEAVCFDQAFLVNQQHQENARAVLIHWYKARANDYIPTTLEPYRKHFSFNKIKITDVKSYWGLCNHKNDLSFNWRTIMAPAETVDYLLIHELAHTQEHNHSKRFWALVEKHCPTYKQHEAWLKAHHYLIDF